MRECQLCKNCFADAVVTCPNDGMPTAHTIEGEPVLEGKYHLECRLGQGGMGVVYKARHAYLKTLHAIKIILPDLVGNDPQLVTRFRQEALAAAAIRHQNVVGVSDYGVINGTVPFLVMEYVDGESLHDLLTREKQLKPEYALELISAICAGVGAAHHQGIVHRDLKPLNIMICNDKPSLSQSVKILDFGLAKIKSGELLGSFIQAQTTGLMGSPYYMAPEQWADEEPDMRADIYSLGVMLFQMLAGDVPFKGSSIPAIMKKHISDPAPTLADFGITVSRDIELALQHTLVKDPAHRTPTVEEMVEEFRDAVHPGMHTSQAQSGYALPVSSLIVRTRPPKSKVFVDNVAVGLSPDDGSLMLEGIQSGNHRLRVSHDGFQDWLGDVVCDGKPVEVVAELRTVMTAAEGAIPKPNFEELSPIVVNTEAATRLRPETPVPGQHMQQTVSPMQQTVPSGFQMTGGSIGVQSMPPKKSKLGWILGIGGIFALFFVVIAGGVGAYMFGLFGGGNVGPGNSASPTPKPGSSPVVIKPDMVQIPGGTFKMGRDGMTRPEELNQVPAHSITVASFEMDRTEVTNAEYAQFVTQTNRTAPKHWVNGQPVAGTENKPVSFVDLSDAIAFAEWRSKRDSVIYRLPTEEEWEYAARNGAKTDIYPWGSQWADGKAVMGKADSEPEAVGSKADGKNIWGVVDLVGNVWEWTSNELAAYPGSNLEIKKKPGRRIMIRGGSANENHSKIDITSAFRIDVADDTKEKTLGFRLVKPG